ncbi:hypothetical protein QQS21_002890 [Conoideocrella luteorostrata]|uniref:Alcohol dehydrogenase iron-type/glycerol dehydrogenase GldA domain-containing protein n=1 Tax=Conoideocrella luteorostrata TaxID=1105319 RepID=A0AAJ0CWU0_9HYPO|nr:hypothetical protein QQS21_002890 [Conoideocrella luteorostrata]
MNTAANSSSANESIPTTTSTKPSPPSAPASSRSPFEAAGSAGGSSTSAAPATSRRKSPSASVGSGSKGQKSPAELSTESSKSTPTEGSHLEGATPRIVYGSGTLTRLSTELGRLCVSSPLIVSSPSRISLARRIQSLIPNLNSRILDSAVVNVPARVVDDAVSRIDDRDVVISVGGASAVGLAKAIGCRKKIPHVCIPTMYSGSEMMPLLLNACPARHSSTRRASSSDKNKSDKHRRRHCEGEPPSRSGRQGPHTTTFRDPKVLPAVVIYDEDLTMSSPRRFSAPSDAVAMARSTELRNYDETTEWSYIHLPGV